MPIFALVIGWLRGQSLKHLLYGGALIVVVLFYIWFVHHERSIGEDRCKAAVVSATVKAQAIADKAAADANAKIDAARVVTIRKLPDLLNIYQDRTKAADCAPYVRPKP